MDDMSRALDEDLLKELECPVCVEYMVPPITLCTNGHNICSKCRETVQCCPTCTAEFSETRSVALENIARRLKYPCANRQSGCLELFSIEHIAEHHTVCVYGNMKCPFQMTGKCSWKGLKNDLKEHAKAKHPNNFHECPVLRSSGLSDALEFVSCFGDLFTFCRQRKDGRLYCAVKLIGTSSEASKYKCEFTLRAANGIEQISNTFLVRSSTEHFGISFNSGKCLNLDKETLRNFLVQNKVKLTITLSTV
jgi:E3 ubiquitin-protein ligase SIAH1